MTPGEQEASRAEPDRQAQRLGDRGRRWRVPLAALCAAAGIGSLLVLTGSGDDILATVEVMGFSPDRSALLTALILELAAVFGAVVLTGSLGAARIGGLVVAAGFFAPTFLDETAKAVAGSGPIGSFDPVGWALSLVTLLLTAILVAWMTSVIAIATRVELAQAWTALRGSHPEAIPWSSRRAMTRFDAPARVGVIVVLLVITVPILGDMLNYEPDVHMRADAIAAGPMGPTGLPGATDGPAASDGPAATPELPPTGNVKVTAARPWLAWRPSGVGSTSSMVLPAPWSVGPATVTLAVYLPPGYSAHSTVRYPVLYEAPWSALSWYRAVNLRYQMDSLIDSGAIPPTIVVFMGQFGGPYPDSECANSYDGREWYDRWVVQTVVPAMDATYATIPTAGARGLIGFSHGGYCAASLLLRHPDIFGSAIAFSGYYQTGIISNQSPDAGLPFNGNPQLEAAYSPITLAPQLPVAVRSHLFVELSTTPTETFYGPQYLQFAHVLQTTGIPFELFPTVIGHSWAEVRTEFASMVRTWAAALAANNVFGT